MTGRIFEIREFCLHDGPGPRTTVFLQGCPLRCTWCHNPEGQSLDGGRVAGVNEVAGEISRTADFLVSSGGGVTFSGGEPLSQGDFVLAIVAALRLSCPALTFALETSGFAAPETYRRVTSEMDLILQDVKFPDVAGYRRWTGIDASPVFCNLAALKSSGRPFIARLPLIPGVNDDVETKGRIAQLLVGSKGLLRVELLPYNRLSGSKYHKLGRVYTPGFDETAMPDVGVAPFSELGIPATVL